MHVCVVCFVLFVCAIRLWLCSWWLCLCGLCSYSCRLHRSFAWCCVACCVVGCVVVAWCVVLCCVVLCCAVLCCAVLCCAVLCCVALCCVAVRCSALQCVALRCVALRCVVSCCVVLLCWSGCQMAVGVKVFARFCPRDDVACCTAASSKGECLQKATRAGRYHLCQRERTLSRGDGICNCIFRGTLRYVRMGVLQKLQ